MVRPGPVRSVMAASEPRVRESITVEVAFTTESRASGLMKVPLTLREESKVELALTKMPAVEEVGVRALVKRSSQAAPPLPVASVPQYSPPVVSLFTSQPAASEVTAKLVVVATLVTKLVKSKVVVAFKRVSKAEVKPEPESEELTVKAETSSVVRSKVEVALSLELNSLWKPAQVEVALNWSVQKAVAPDPCKVVLTVRASMTEEVAFKEAARRSEAVSRPLTLKEESKVEEALTKMPAVEEVGVRALVKSRCQAAPAEAPVASVPQ